ncbi:WD40-repeat-containing domain protein [Peziza echinospora]|nr:WD40-repeat-containing domain protein [Peziza echinospora]
MASAATDRPLSVQIKLFTRDQEIAVPSAPLLVPTTLRRYGLSQVVNHLLETEKAIPLDFLIDGTFLRTSLDEYLTQNGLSSESVLTLEYARSILPPTHLASFEHDDWVSSVATISQSATEARKAGQFLPQGQSRILSGSYDGIARIWDLSGNILAEASGHTAAVKAVDWISQDRLLTASLDRTVRLWSYAEDEDHTTGTVTALAEYIGHKSAINTIAISPSTNQFITSSLDGTSLLWSTSPTKSPPAAPQVSSTITSRQSKKRKTTASNLIRLGPLSVLQQPTPTAIPQAISATIFHPKDPQFAYSTTWSHTILTHDLLTSQCIDTRTTSHPILSIVALPSLSLLACGSSARHITLHDPRADAHTVSQAILRGHTNSVSALAASPQSEFLMVSSSYDGFCRVWDVRAAGAQGSLYTIKREGGDAATAANAGGIKKVFDVKWSKEVGIVSGGEDKRVQVNSGGVWFW